MKRFLRILASRGIAGISDCIIIATIALLFWFVAMSESQMRYLWAGLSCLGFVVAYLIYRVADRVHDGV